jgi:stage II sporulation protein D
MPRLLLLLLLPLLTGSSPIGKDTRLRIGLFADREVRRVVVMTSGGSSTIRVDGQRVGDLHGNDGLRMEVTADGIHLRSLTLDLKAKEQVELVPRAQGGGLRIKAPDLKGPERHLPGGLLVSLTKKRNLRLVTVVPLEEYVAGVVLSEAGKGHHPEYYKLQAVSCRTYALANRGRHAADGYELCDQVHCQVFHGRNHLDVIAEAVEDTRGLVAVDADIRLVQATFHSNCGGETIDAEDLWTGKATHLRATRDTFCLAAPHATWRHEMRRGEWLAYLERKHGLRRDDTAAVQAMLAYDPACRDIYLGNTLPLVPLKQVRADLKLRSTYFTITTTGEQVVFEGRGFGHGVGLCQEGAMGMASAGIGFTDILHHYYDRVHLVDMGLLDFFRDEGR